MNPVFDPLQRKMVSGPEAGQNVDVDGFEVSFSGGSTGGVYNAGSGLTLSGNTFSVPPGYRMNTSGGTVNQDRFFPVETVSGTSVTLQAGHAYIINATTSAGITLNCESFAANTFGLEGHATIYTANAGYVQQGANVFLADPLEPDAVNNCTIRFHGGSATVSVEDYFGGYIVLSGGTGSGSLPYGLASAGSQYIGFNASLNGQTLDLSGVVANGEKHIVGNGYTETILTGAVNCGSSSFTIANLGLNNVQVTGGTMTLGDAYIPMGSTVAVATSDVAVDGVTTTVPLGSMAIEKVTGAGSDSVIDCGGTDAIAHDNYIPVYSGVSIINYSATTGIGYKYGASPTWVNCVLVNNRPGRAAIETEGYGGAIGNISNCTVTGNYTSDISARPGSTINLNGGSVIGKASVSNNGKLVFKGINKVDSVFGSGTVTLTSGAILNLTDNANTTPIAPGGGITFEAGGATVYPSAGSAAAVNLNIAGGMFGCSAITNGGMLVMPSAAFPITAGATLSGNATIDVPNQSVVPNATFNGVTFTGSGHIVGNAGATITFSACTISVPLRNRTVGKYGNYVFAGNCTVQSISNDSDFTSGTVTIASGATLDLTGNSNPVPIAPGGGIVFEEGGATVRVGDSTASSSYFVAGAKVDSVTNSNSIVFANDTNGVNALKNTIYSNCAVVVRSNGLPRPAGVLQTAVFSDCSIDINTGRMYYQTDYGAAHITFGGRIGFNFALTRTGTSMFTSSGTIDIKPNTILDITSRTVASSSLISAPFGLTVADNDPTKSCTIESGGSVVASISGGSYTIINADGTTVPPQE